MDEIVQSIWDADQNSTGVRPVLPGQVWPPDPEPFVVVDAGRAVDSGRLFPVVRGADREVYGEVQELRRAYQMGVGDRRARARAWVASIAGDSPLRVAEAWLTDQGTDRFRQVRGAHATWEDFLDAFWFTEPPGESSAFEHLFVGCPNELLAYDDGSNPLGGYHFWHAFCVDERAKRGPSRVAYVDVAADPGELPGMLATPEVCTVNFLMRFTDAEGTAYRLQKEQGGFFNGCSAAGLLALALVRFYGRPVDVYTVVLNGAELRLIARPQADASYLRTFYPVYAGRCQAGPLPSIHPRANWP